GHLVLQIEDILDVAIEAIGPQMCPSFGIDQLAGYAEPVCRLADAAFEYITHPELAPHLLHVYRAAFVVKARIARDDDEGAHARKGRDDLLCHAISEILLFRIAAQIDERQDRDRGLYIGDRRRRSVHRR